MSNPRFDFDVLVSCPDCKAAVGVGCAGTFHASVVHFSRRIDALLKEKGVTRAELEERLACGDDMAEALASKKTFEPS